MHLNKNMKTFKKYEYLPAPPEEVYLALTKELSIQLWTGAAVEFTEEPGTEFSFWGKRNIRL